MKRVGETWSEQEFLDALMGDSWSSEEHPVFDFHPAGVDGDLTLPSSVAEPSSVSGEAATSAAPLLAAHARDVVARRGPAGKVRKPNKIPKGDGPDGRPDPAGRDSYEFEGGYFHSLLAPRIKKTPSQAVIRFARCVAASNLPGLTPTNRWVGKRTANAYGWLDENKAVITGAVIAQCWAQLAAEGYLL
jgi:hypothetical protein